MVFRKIYLLLLLIPISFMGCHTFFWQNVGNTIEGTWTLMPVTPGSTTQFTFESGNLSVTRNSIPRLFKHIDNGSTVPQISYVVENKFNNQYLLIEDAYELPGYGYQSHMFEKTDRWLVITAKEDELFLESEGKDGLKGEFQIHLFRF